MTDIKNNNSLAVPFLSLTKKQLISPHVAHIKNTAIKPTRVTGGLTAASSRYFAHFALVQKGLISFLFCYIAKYP